MRKTTTKSKKRVVRKPVKKLVRKIVRRRKKVVEPEVRVEEEITPTVPEEVEAEEVVEHKQEILYGEVTARRLNDNYDTDTEYHCIISEGNREHTMHLPKELFK
jgi:hypothetical protein